MYNTFCEIGRYYSKRNRGDGGKNKGKKKMTQKGQN